MAKPKPSKEVLQQEKESIQQHIMTVAGTMDCVATMIRIRGKHHDASKLTDAELPYFAEANTLKQLPYGSKRYNDQLAIGSALRPALDHHYASNRHHPEHHEDGIAGMSIVDIIEMLSDWLAAGLRHGAGHNIFHSINVNRMRFKIKKDLAQIMWNTATTVFGEEPEEGEELSIIHKCGDCGNWQDTHYSHCQECRSMYLIEI